MALFKKKEKEEKERQKSQEEIRKREEEYWRDSRKRERAQFEEEERRRQRLYSIDIKRGKKEPGSYKVVVQSQPVYIGKKQISFATIMLLCLLAIIAIVFFFNCFGIGVCQAWASEAKISLAPFGEQVKRLSIEAITYLRNPQEFEARIMRIGDWTNPGSKRLEQEKKGVLIKEFSSRRLNYKENQPIFLEATLEVKSLERDTELILLCNLEGYEGNKVTRLVRQDIDGEEVTLFLEKGYDATIPVVCIFEDGLKADSEKEISSKKANLTIVYNYGTKSMLRLYTLNEELQRSVEDPFSYYGVKQTLTEAGLWSNGLVKASQESGGPIELAIGVEDQPLGIGNYGLVVRLLNHFETWNGDLGKILDLRLRLPVDVEVNERFCQDFDSRSLKQEIVDEINENDCTTNDLFPGATRYKECAVKHNKNDLKFFCEITLTDVKETPMEFLPLEVTLEYTYKLEKEANVRIIRSEIVEKETPIEESALNGK